MSKIDDALCHAEVEELLREFEADGLDDSKHLVLISVNTDGGWSIKATQSLPALSYFGVLCMAQRMFIEDNA